MKGRKPKPTALQALHGNTRHRGTAALARVEASARQTDDGAMDPPDDLTEGQRAIWRAAIADAPAGILRRIDTMALRVWVVACDLHRQACAAQASTPLLVKASQKEGAMAMQSPYLPIINRQGVMMLRAAEQLGFSPIARARITLAPQAADLPASAAARPMALEDYIASAPKPPLVH